ncbi:hypothetical protein B0H19DRAFT_1271476 [Mycena capillaripes]|nr:hypothetical protein B0H19DRAFT_1271476 [Mycena capillaripes]
MMKSHFLSLPSELILACLVNLPSADLDSCLKCRNRLLRSIILNSVFLRYRRAQELAGVEENADRPLNLGISDRLACLRRREASWLTFAPRSRHTISTDFQTTGLYDLTSEIYFVGDTADPNTSLCTSLKYVYTSPGTEASQWHTINAGKPIVDFGTALEEHDLIAMVTYTLNGAKASIDVLLLNFSTGAPHPLAAQPTLHIHDVELNRGRPGVSLEIVGQNLALSLMYWNDESRDMDGLYLYNWKSGLAKIAALPINNTGLAFLTPDIIIVPNAAEATLDVLHIRPEDGEGADFLHAFHLPTLAGHTGVFSFQCRGAPNPCASISRPSRSPFLPRPSDSILIFALTIISLTSETEYTFVVPRARLARMLDLRNRELDDATGIDVDWEAWGPQCTRWLDATTLSTQYITATVGQRMVTIARNAPLVRAPIRVLDFNETNVQKQRANGLVEGPHAVVRVVEETTLDLEPFALPVVSLLPYVETTSKDLFDYDAVLINDENIIGARFGDRSVESLEVLHFG